MNVLVFSRFGFRRLHRPGTPAPATRKDYARWAASREPFHAVRWRWRYWIKWRLIGRKGPL